jgi:lambda family phage tail tape measure protein
VASNISVTLVIDNKQYIASLNQADRATTNFAKTTATTANAATTSFNRVNASAGTLHVGLSRLAGVATGAAFIGLAASAITLADAVDDLSKATGFTIASIVGLQGAVKGFGISMEQTNKSLGFFFTKIDEAAEGGAKAQATFAQLGIDLGDLRTLSEQGLLNKVIEQLALLPQSAQKTAIQGELLGKAFRNVVIDPAFVADLKAGEGAAGEMAEQIARAARLNDQFEASMFKLKLAFLQAFGPIIDGISTVASALSKWPGLIELVSIALLAIPGIAVGRAIVSGLSFAVKGFQALTGAARVAGAAVAKVGSSKAAQKAAAELAQKGRLGVAANSAAGQQVRNVGSAVGAAVPVVAGVAAGANAVLGGGADKASEAAALAAGKEAAAQRQVTDALAGKRAELNAVYTSYLKANQAQIDTLNLDSKLIGKSKEFADAERARADVLKRSADEIQKLEAQKAQMNENDKKLGLGKVYDEQIAKIRSVQAAEAEKAAAATENNNRLITLDKMRNFELSQQVNLNQQLATLQDNIATQMLPEIEKRYYAIGAAAKASAAAEIAAEESRLGRKLNTAEIENYYKIAALGSEKLKQKQLELLQVESKRSLVLFGIKAQIDSENKLLSIQDEMAKLTLPTIEQKYYDIAAAARDTAKAAIEAQEATLGRKLDPAEVKAYYDAASAGSAKLARQTKSLYDQSRTFSTGWKKAFNEYRDAATNAASAAARVFEKFTSGLEDALVDFAKTGKFEWKNFVADMAEELLRSQIKQTIAGLGSAFGLGDLFGGGGGAPGDTPNNPTYAYVVNGGDMGGLIGSMAGGGGGAGGGGILGSIFGSGQKSPTTSGGGGGGGIGGILGSIGSGIGNVFSGITNAVGSIFGGGDNAGVGRRDAGGGGGGFFSGISDLFSGFFANGGNIPRGRFGIAGESGPELIGGPASVTPMSGTQVTYNINAVDAASFKAMIARDPTFLYAVSEQGRKSVAGAR